VTLLPRIFPSKGEAKELFVRCCLLFVIIIFILCRTYSSINMTMRPFSSTRLAEENAILSPALRRASLDNSCLAAPDSLQRLLQDSCHAGAGDEFYSDGSARPRRYSLDNNTTTPTFLSDLKPRKPKGGLDADFHASTHNKSKTYHSSNRTGGRSSHASIPKAKSDHIQSGGISPLETSRHGEHEATRLCDSSLEDDDAFDSDCDSFCDASVQEEANHDYIMDDLGASCYISMKTAAPTGDIIEDEEDGHDA
jgi:hypothetical protein